MDNGWTKYFRNCTDSNLYVWIQKIACFPRTNAKNVCKILSIKVSKLF